MALSSSFQAPSRLAGSSAASAQAEERALRRSRRFRSVFVTVVSWVAGGAVGWAGVLHASAPAVLVGSVLLLAGCVSTALAWSGPDPGRWARAAQTEAATGRLLESLPSRRYRVLHDLRVPGSRANIDHVVIGTSGVWVVDTKSTLGLIRRGWRSVALGGRRLDRRALRWQTDTIRDRFGCDPRLIVALYGRGKTLPRRGVRLGGGVRALAAADVASYIDRWWRRHRLANREIDRLSQELGALGSDE